MRKFTPASITTSLPKTLLTLLLLVAFSSFSSAQYCQSTATSADDSDIGQVTFGTLTNGTPLPTLNNPSANPLGYNDFTALPAPVVSLGQVVPISVVYISESGQTFGANVKAYIDYNNDGDFTDAGEDVFTGSTTNGSFTTSGFVTIPPTANVGVTRLRVILNEFTVSGPCGNYTYGETEDYSIELVTTLFADDIGVTSLEAPLPPVAGTNIPLKVRMRNYGYNSLTNAVISYTINGGTPVDFNYTGPSLASNTISNIITLGNFSPAANDVVRVFTQKPNSPINQDPNTVNDTLIFKICSGGAPLIGTKTIGGLNPDYPKIIDAVSALQCNGISGPVTFNIRPGVYNERIFLTPVTGSSSTNTITFTTAGTPKDVIINGTFGNTIHLNGADYVTIKNLIVLNKGIFEGAGILLSNQADFNTIENNVVRVDSTSKEAKFVGIGALTGFVGTLAGNHANNTIVKDNVIVGGSWGIYFTGLNTTTRGILNTITGNTITKSYNAGIFTLFNNGIDVIHNKVRLREESSSSSTGISINSCSFILTKNTVVRRNYVTNASLNGIIVNTVLGISAANSADFSNNMVAGGFKSNSTEVTAIPTGISVSASSFINFYYNSVNMDAPSESSRAFFQTGGANLRIAGNVFSNDSVGVAYFISTPAAITQSEFNNYFSAQGQFFGIWNNIGYSDISDLALINGKEIGSLKVDPQFFGFDDLHTNNPLLDATGPNLISVPDDYDGQARSTLSPSDFGADAFLRYLDDLAVVDISPKTLKIGANAIDFTVKNFGVNPRTGTCFYRIQLNGVNVNSTSTEFIFSSTSTTPPVLALQPGESRVFSFNLPANALNITALGTYEVCVLPVLGGGCAGEDNISNDKFCVTVCTGKEGDLLVGPTRTYKKIQDALDELVCGIAGKVTIKMDPGTYNEQLLINKYVNSSNVNNVTLTSATGNAGDVIIKSSGISAVNHATVIFNGTKDIVLSKLTIVNEGVNFGSGVQITNASENVKVVGCVIKVDSTSVRTTFAPITGSALGSFSDKGKNGNFVTIRNNILRGGYFGITLTGKDENNLDVNDSILNNRILNVYSYGIFTSSTDARIEDNVITGRKLMNTSGGTGIFVSKSKNGRVNGNKISAITFQGISIVDVGQGSKQFIVSNNFIGAGFSYFSNLASAISVRGSTNIGVHYNSVNFDGDTISAGALYVTDLANGNLALLNNNFACIKGSKILTVVDAGAISNANNNNYYQAGLLKSKVFAYWGKNYRSLVALQTGTGKDKLTKSVLPNFRTETDLHSKNPLVNSKGTQVLGITKDIDKENRKGLPGKPDIGADEFENTEFDLDVTAVLNNVVRTNVGLKTLADKSCQLQFSIDNGPWTGTSTVQLTPLDKIFKTFNYVFTIPWNNPDRLDHDICVRIVPGSLPSDIVNDNDFACDRVCTGLDGNRTVGNKVTYPTADYGTIKEALDSIGCGIAGPLNISIYPGVYPEKLVIPFYELSYDNPFLTINSVDSLNKAQIKGAGNNVTRSHAIIRLDGSQNVRLRNLLIENTSTTFASAVQFTGNAKNNVLDKCDINVNKTNNSTTNIIAITSTSPFSILGAATNGTANTISNNIISGGWYGIYMIGNGEANRDQGNVIKNNVIKDFVFAGIFTKYVDLPLISKNKVSARTPGSSAQSKGIYVSYSYGDQKIDGNFVEKVQFAGIELFNIFGTKEFIVSNNLITNGFKSTSPQSAGIIADTCLYVGIYHNNVRYDNPSSLFGSAFRASPGAEIVNVNNNIFANYGNGLCMNIAPIGEFFTSNNNNLYVANTANRFAVFDNGPDQNGVVVINANDVKANLLGFTDASGLDENSFVLLPPFTNAVDLEFTDATATAYYKAGKTSPGVLFDYKDNKRSPRKPTVGAYEYNLEPTDISIIKVRPDTTFLGNNDVKVTLLNEGKTSLVGKTISVSYKINSDATWRAAEIVTLTTLDTTYDREVFIFNLKLFKADYNSGSVCVRIERPGLQNDNINNPINLPNFEELCQDFCTAIKGGKYTVGGPGADFTNLTQVANALQCGYTDSVIFSINPGTYNERFTLPQYFEKTPADSIIFQSSTGNPDDVIIKSQGLTNADHSVIRLNGTGFVRFKNLTIQNTSLSRGSAVHFTNGANNNIISNCKILLDTVSIANSLIGVVMSGTGGQTDPSYGSLNKIEKSLIRGGAYGISFVGDESDRNSGNAFNKNTFRNNNVTAIKVVDANVDSIFNNNIIMRKGNNKSFGIDLEGLNEDIDLSSNYLYGAGKKGFTLKRLNGLFKNIIANNMIAGGFADVDSNNIAFELIESSSTDIIHNSVKYDSSGTSPNSSVVFYIQGGNENRVLNNIFSNFGGGLSYIADEAAASSDFVVDYNDLYTNGATLAISGVSTYANLSLLVATGQNLNSISVRPTFFSPTNLHTSDVFLDSKGLKETGILLDIDGQVRDLISPDIGADEFNAVADGGVIAILSPDPSAPLSGNITIKVAVKNFSTVNYVNPTLEYQVTGENPVTQTFPFTILPDSTKSFTFNTPWASKNSGNLSICARTVNVNDLNFLNDSSCILLFNRDTLDLSTVTFLTPVDGANISANKPTNVSVIVSNLGNTTVNNYSMALELNGANVETKVIQNANLAKFTSQVVNFTYKLITSLGQTYELCAFPIIAGEVDFTNDTACATLTGTVGILQLGSGNGSVNIYPNPVNFELNFDLNLDKSENVKIEVFDIVGKLISSEDFGTKQAGKENIKIPTSEYANGTYLFSVQVGDQVLRSYVVVSH